MRNAIFFLTVMLLFLSEAQCQNDKSIHYMISGQMAHVFSFGGPELLEFNNSRWVNLEAVVSMRIKNDEVQLGVSHNSYKRNIYDYQKTFGCDLMANGQVDDRASGIEYKSSRRLIGIPINYVKFLKKEGNRIGLKFGFEPRFWIEQKERTLTTFECGYHDPSIPNEWFLGPNKSTLYFTKIGLTYELGLGSKVSILIEPLVEILLNKDQFVGIPIYSSPDPISNRIVNAGLKLGVRL